MSKTEHISRTGAHYDNVTEAWRLVMGESFHYGLFGAPGEPLGRATLRLNARMLAAAGSVGTTSRVLDVGCGVGGPARWLATETGAEVLGISTSARGVEVAREQTTPSLSGRVHFAVADAQDNKQGDESFDLAWVLESSHLMPRKAQLLAECARVLRPGGRLVLCDLMTRRPFELAEVFAQHARLQCLDRVFGRAKMETMDVYRELCESVGLVGPGGEDLSDATRPTLEAWRENLGTHRVKLVELTGTDAVDDFAEACEILLKYWDEGRMGYGIVWASKP